MSPHEWPNGSEKRPRWPLVRAHFCLATGCRACPAWSARMRVAMSCLDNLYIESRSDQQRRELMAQRHPLSRPTENNQTLPVG